jgi:hypothetical protein
MGSLECTLRCAAEFKATVEVRAQCNDGHCTCGNGTSWQKHTDIADVYIAQTLSGEAYIAVTPLVSGDLSGCLRVQWEGACRGNRPSEEFQNLEAELSYAQAQLPQAYQRGYAESRGVVVAVETAAIAFSYPSGGHAAVTPAYGPAGEQEFFVLASWATSEELEVRFSLVYLADPMDAEAQLATLSPTDQESLRSGLQLAAFFPYLPRPAAGASAEYLSTWQSRPWIRTRLRPGLWALVAEGRSADGTPVVRVDTHALRSPVRAARRVPDG